MSEKTITLQDPPKELFLKQPKTVYEKLDFIDKKNDELLKKILTKKLLFEVIEYMAYAYLLYWALGKYGIDKAFLLLGLIFFINVVKQLRTIAQAIEKKGDDQNGKPNRS